MAQSVREIPSIRQYDLVVCIVIIRIVIAPTCVIVFHVTVYILPILSFYGYRISLLVGYLLVEINIGLRCRGSPGDIFGSRIVEFHIILRQPDQTTYIINPSNHCVFDRAVGNGVAACQVLDGRELALPAIGEALGPIVLEVVDDTVEGHGTVGVRVHVADHQPQFVTVAPIVVAVAHGDILMVGAFIGLIIYNALTGGEAADPGAWTILAFFISMLASMGFCAILGMAIERIAYKPLRNANRLAPLLSAIGVSFILSNGAAWIFGTTSRRFPYPFENEPIHLGGVTITPHQILVVIVSIIMMVLLAFFVNKTRMGKAMRATSLDQNTSALMGINVNRVISLTFAIGSALAAVGGMLASFDFRVYPSMGTMTGLKAFVAAVIGGIGNIQGAMIGGVLLGILEAVGAPLLHIPNGMRDTVAFAVLIIILLVKPEGILGKNEREKV